MPGELGERWTVRQGRAEVNLRERRMSVPLSADAHARAARAHELGHVAISPPDGVERAEARGIRPETVQVVEDARLQHWLYHRGVRDVYEHGAIPFEARRGVFLHLARSGNLRVMTTSLVAAIYDSAHRGLASTMADEGGDLGGLAVDLAARAKVLLFDEDHDDGACFEWDERGDPYPTFERTLQVAEWLDRALATIEAALSKGDDPHLAAHRAGLYGEDKGSVTPWGAMTVEEPPRPVRLPLGALASRWTAREEATLLRYPHRSILDGRVFGRLKRVPGGTVLIDQSGSMSLSAGDVARIIQAAPGATIAGYAGDDYDGTLRILARRGRRATELDHPSRGNVVDGPALVWLARQPEPRIWVCDGHVTGIRDCASHALTDEAFAIARTGNIVRVEDAATAHDVLRRLRAASGR